MVSLINDLDLLRNVQEIVLIDPKDVRDKLFPYTFKMINFNIRSYNKNIDEFFIELQAMEIEFDVIVLTECWISDTFIPRRIQGYTGYSTVQNKLKSDGVVIYAKSKYHVTVTEHNIRQANCLSMQLSIEDIIVIITAVYRSPSHNDITEFLADLELLLNTNNKHYHVITGDLNINTNELAQHRQLNDYEDLLSMFGFTHCIRKPTRISDNSTSCIDHILVNFNKDLRSVIFQNSITDHYMTMLGFNHNSRLVGINKKDFYEVFDQLKISNLLENENWISVLSRDNVEIAFKEFMLIISDVLFKSKKIIKIAHNKKKLKPWITQGLISSIRKRDKLHRQSKNNPNNIQLGLYYKRYRNLLTNLIEQAKKNYFSERLNLSKDSKNMWKNIKEIIDDQKINEQVKQLITSDKTLIAGKDDKEIADAYNRFFQGVGSDLAENILKETGNINNGVAEEVGGEVVHNGQIPNSLFFAPVTEEEILKIIDNLNNNSAPGPDGIKPNFFRMNGGVLSRPLVHLINLTFEKGIFPRSLKEAVICPIFKSGDKCDVNCYRPISLLNTLSKIYEMSIKSRLVSFLDKNNIISSNQHGFRSSINTSDAILKVVSEITSCINSGNKSLVVFLDLRKAFDTVSHTLLLERLHSYGVRGVALDLFRSYLTDRFQSVRLNGHLSDKLRIEYGVPQGTVLGPILFTVYINPLCNMDIKGKITAFADDTALLFADSEWNAVERKAEEGLRMVKRWLDMNLLSLNIQKTHYLCFSPNSQGQPDNQYLAIHSCLAAENCQCQQITRQTSIKYLGVIIDSMLRWDLHIKGLCQRIRKTFYIFKRLRMIVNINTLKMVYYSFVQSILVYGIVGWGGASSCHMNPLQRVQKLVIKIILRKPMRYPTEEVFNNFQVMNVRQLYVREILKKIHNNSSSMTVREHPYNTRNRHLYLLDRARISLYQRHFNYLAPKIYNLLPLEIRALNNYKFKNKIQNWIFNTGRGNIERIVVGD